MKTEIYQWVKSLAVFYILFSAVLHLIPDPKYERYIKLFMGLLLIYILCAPVFTLMGKGEELMKNFSIHYQEELEEMDTAEAENLRKLYLNQGYCRELEQEITEKLRMNDIYPQNVTVHTDGEDLSVEIYASESLTQDQERRIRDELTGDFGIGEKNIRILPEGNEPTAVGSPAAAWDAADGDIDTDSREK